MLHQKCTPGTSGSSFKILKAKPGRFPEPIFYDKSGSRTGPGGSRSAFFQQIRFPDGTRWFQSAFFPTNQVPGRDPEVPGAYSLRQIRFPGGTRRFRSAFFPTNQVPGRDPEVPGVHFFQTKCETVLHCGGRRLGQARPGMAMTRAMGVATPRGGGHPYGGGHPHRGWPPP